jgi:hypothetical protein
VDAIDEKCCVVCFVSPGQIEKTILLMQVYGRDCQTWSDKLYTDSIVESFRTRHVLRFTIDFCCDVITSCAACYVTIGKRNRSYEDCENFRGFNYESRFCDFRQTATNFTEHKC